MGVRLPPFALPLGIVSVFWLISAAFVGLDGDFPIFDDWAYTRTVAFLTQQRTLHLDDAMAVLVLPQILVGWAVTAVTGFSFEVLRAIGVIASMLAAAASYAVMRYMGTDRTAATIAALAVSVNPVLHVGAFSFLSDGPTTALVAAAFAAYVASTREGARRWLWLAVAVAIAGVLNRHTVLAVVLGIAAGHLAPPFSARRAVEAIAMLVATWLALTLAESVVVAQQGHLPAAYVNRSSEPGAMLRQLLSFGAIYQVTWAFVRQFLYLGLYAAPVWLVCRVPLGRIGPTVAVLLFGVLIVTNRHLPLLGGILYEHGSGPVMIHGLETLSSRLGAPFWWALTVAALAGMAGLIDVIIRASIAVYQHGMRQTAATRLRVACLVTIAAVTGLHALVGPFDRHLLILQPAVFVLIAFERGKPLADIRRVAAIALCAALGVFSILTSRDCLEWLRARWTVVRALELTGVSPSTIDGGLEYNRFQTGIVGFPVWGTETHHLRFVSVRPAGAICASYEAWIGPRAAAICVAPGPGPKPY